MYIKEKIVGTKSNRERPNNIINELQEGDVVIITHLTRVSRSTKDLLKIIDNIKSKGH